MKLNQNLIQQLRNGEIAVENNGTVDQLREVLKAAFPEDKWITDGSSSYYYLSTAYASKWICGNKTNLPTFKISDFYDPKPFTGWAKDDNHPEWMMYFKDEVSQYGFEFDGYWASQHRTPPYKYSSSEYNRPATHEEIETTLTKEAKRRGYKGGNTIKGLYGTTHFRPKISSFYYDQRWDRLLTNDGCIVYEKGQWAEIVEKPQAKPIHYLVDGTEYLLDYQDLKSKYQAVVNYSDEQFMDNLPEIAHLACIVAYFKGLGNNATIGDKGIIHELIHLMTDPDEPTNDLAEIREKFNWLIQLV